MVFLVKLLVRVGVLGLAAFGGYKLYEEWSAVPSSSGSSPSSPSHASVVEDARAADTVAPGAAAGVDGLLP